MPYRLAIPQYGKNRRNRTFIFSFGDCRSTVELCPYMVPGMGFEPIRQRRRILNPLCLPIPPTRHLCACHLNCHILPPAGKYFTSLWEYSFQRPLSFFMGNCATPISAGGEPATGSVYGGRTRVPGLKGRCLNRLTNTP